MIGEWKMYTWIEISLGMLSTFIVGIIVGHYIWKNNKLIHHQNGEERMIRSKFECWNCGIVYKRFLNFQCPNCKIDYFDSWKYKIDWKNWFLDMSIAFKKLSDALNQENM